MNNPYLNGCGCKAWELKTHERCNKKHLCKDCIHDAEIFKEGVALTLKDVEEGIRKRSINALGYVSDEAKQFIKELKQILKELQ